MHSKLMFDREKLIIFLELYILTSISLKFEFSILGNKTSSLFQSFTVHVI